MKTKHWLILAFEGIDFLSKVWAVCIAIGLLLAYTAVQVEGGVNTVLENMIYVNESEKDIRRDIIKTPPSTVEVVKFNRMVTDKESISDLDIKLSDSLKEFVQ